MVDIAPVIKHEISNGWANSDCRRRRLFISCGFKIAGN
jgi:hypothetical protein